LAFERLCRPGLLVRKRPEEVIRREINVYSIDLSFAVLDSNPEASYDGAIVATPGPAFFFGLFLLLLCKFKLNTLQQPA
jgi:hypothetical protein